uniref:Uncharacterized protein n=1 Tax=viral metagenome TaxID=1070528 RepID=A0A6H2A278_9ZZZZ
MTLSRKEDGYLRMTQDSFVEAANEMLGIMEIYEGGGELPSWIKYDDLEKLCDILTKILIS